MIFVKEKTFAKVWKVTKADNGKYIDLQISTSEKETDGTYKNSRWFPRCIGKSVNTLKDVKEGDRIEIEKCKLTNESYETDSGEKRSRFRFIILEASISGGKKQESTATATEKPAATVTKTEEPEKEEIPW